MRDDGALDWKEPGNTSCTITAFSAGFSSLKPSSQCVFVGVGESTAQYGYLVPEMDMPSQHVTGIRWASTNGTYVRLPDASVSP